MERDPEYFKWVYEQTRIVKQPTFGIHSGYHDLPYILVGESESSGSRSTEIRGKILVSPKMVVSPSDHAQSYQEVFDASTMDETIIGRIFAFKWQRSPVALQQEDFSRRNLELPVSETIERVLDELERREIINTGVIQTPEVDFYPISVDKFITAVLDQEFA